MKRFIAAFAITAVAVLGVAGSAQATLIQFRSPSGNIHCAGSNAGGTANFVRCDVVEHTWSPPAKPASCTFDWGLGFTLARRGSARWVCASDSVFGATHVLRYGKVIKVGRLLCRSRRVGITCRNRWGYGFTVSRTVARRFRVLP